MGKAEKIKEQRRIDKMEKEKKLKQKRILIFKYSLTVVLSAFFTTGMVYSYNRWFPENQWPKNRPVKIKNTDNKPSYEKEPEMTIDVNKTYFASFETSEGNFKIELLAKNAPKTVNNFVYLARENYYNGLIFHRVIEDFMIQSGCPKGDGTGGPGYEFEDEINGKMVGLTDDDLVQAAAAGYKFSDTLETIQLGQGILAMANRGPNTNGSQFFVVTAESTPWLNGKHTPFGRVIEGMDAVLKISRVETSQADATKDKPLKDVVINKITIEEI
jgi:cyclophilin family peptidyl-prolyl cis-trans isomerase